MENNKIVKKSILYFIGNFSSKILSSLLVPIYAFYISSEVLGIYDYSQTLMNILIPIIFVSIWEAIIRFILGNAKNKNKDKELASSAIFNIIICILFAIITIGLNEIIDISYVGYFIPMVCATALAQIWQYYSRALQRNKLYVITSVISTFTNLLLNIILIMVFNMKIEALYLSYICSQFIAFLIIEFNLKIIKLINKKNIDLYLLKKMLVYSAPLVVNSIAAWAFNGFGKIIIFENLGASNNGIYTFANKFVTIITTIGSVINMAILEETMLSIEDDNFSIKYSRLLEQVFKMSLALIIIAMPAIAIFYLFIGSTEYYESLYLLPFLLLYSIMLNMSINFGLAFKVANKNKYQIITTIIGSIVMILISYILLDFIGIYAVAIGQVMSVIAMLISRYYISRRFIKYSINWKPIILLIGIYIIISLISIINIKIIKFIIFIFSIIIAILFNKEFVITILKEGWRSVKKIRNKS